MATYRIESASKDAFANEGALRKAAAEAFPGWKIALVEDSGKEWDIRLEKDADLPPFLKKKDDDSADSPDEGSPEEEASESPDEEALEDDGGDSKDEKPSKGDKDKGGDPLKHLQTLMGDLQNVVKELVDHAGDVHQDAQEKQDKIDEIHDSVKDDASGGGEGALPPMPVDPAVVGPTPGMPPSGRGPKPNGKGGFPSRGPGRMGPPGGVSTFTKRKTEVVTHPGTDVRGERISMVAAAAALEADDEFADYYVAGMVENADGSYAAKLKLRQQ